MTFLPYSNILMIGNTGMLRRVSIELAEVTPHLTSVARTTQSLNELDRWIMKGLATTHDMLCLDWTDSDHFLRSVIDHFEGESMPELIVAWIHNDDLAMRLFRELASHSSAMRFFHILGSSSRNVIEQAEVLRASAEVGQEVARYHQVVLGHIDDEHGRRRWLTHAEISSGVLQAIREDRLIFVVGKS